MSSWNIFPVLFVGVNRHIAVWSGSYWKKKKTVAEEEEMSDSPQPPKLSPDQEAALESHFRRNKNVHASDVAILSAETGLDEEQVQVFFLFYFKKIFKKNEKAASANVMETCPSMARKRFLPWRHSPSGDVTLKNAIGYPDHATRIELAWLPVLRNGNGKWWIKVVRTLFCFWAISGAEFLRKTTTEDGDGAQRSTTDGPVSCLTQWNVLEKRRLNFVGTDPFRLDVVGGER